MMPRRAFTLFELLVVMGMLAILAGITVGGLIRNQGGTGLESVTSLVADVIRQARHTAASSGAPVEIRLEQEEGAWLIRGVTQITLHGEQFDTGFSHPDPSRPPLGYAGYGFDLGAPFSTPDLPARPALVNDPANDSFYLECQVAPPLTRDGAMANDTMTCYPVALQDGTGDLAFLQLVDTGTAGATSTGPQTWQPVAGIRTAGGDVILTGPELDPRRYHRIGLMYRGGTVELLVNGVQEANASAVVDMPSGAVHLTYGNAYPAGVVSAGTVDNVRLYRIGDDNPVRLPRFIEPDAARRLVVRPDGSVTGAGTWTFRWTGGGAGQDPFAITIDGAGRVTGN